MKKYFSLFLIFLLIFLTGCSATSPSEEETYPLAVDTELLNLYGSDQATVMEKYGLSEDRKHEKWPDYYLGDIVWCGEEYETQFLFTDEVLTFVKCGKAIDNNDAAQETVSSVIAQFNAQFGEPKAFTSQYDWVPEPKQEYVSEVFESNLQSFWDAENGALLCFSYESEEIPSSVSHHYIECVFLRNENTQPGKVYIVLLVGNASFGYISEGTNLDYAI